MRTTDTSDILVVEDSETDRELIMRALKIHNLANDVHVAVDGQDALDYMFQGRTPSEKGPVNVPRVILLDLKLPRVNGVDVLRILKGDERTKTIPVVVLTSSSQKEDVLRAYAAGANSYVVKPFAFTDFSRAVASAGLYWQVINHAPEGGLSG